MLLHMKTSLQDWADKVIRHILSRLTFVKFSELEIIFFGVYRRDQSAKFSRARAREEKSEVVKLALARSPTN